VIGAELQAPDVSDAASIRARAAALKGRPIDFVISNAGLGDRADMPRPDDERFGESCASKRMPRSGCRTR
jgi:NAD(P)-dependent dehydrogenase (short-subunit alcohol dehydrogenase family)